MFGSAVADGRGLARLFPTPPQLANAAIERAGVMPARAETIRLLARHAADRTITFSAGLDGRVTVSALRALPGIGDWTAEYIAMRALGEPDAFPSGDLVLRRAAGDCTARELARKSQAWRPWRAYAVMLLWQGAKDDPEGSRRIGRANSDAGSRLDDRDSRSAHVVVPHATR
jgi:AraC family transcriptional regulator of adaptative response / DNA-3-methyladenine glycosylase II